MLTSDEIASGIATALDRQIQDALYGNVALNADGSNPSDVPYTVPVRLEGQEETYFAYYSPFIDATKLSDNTRVILKYERDGQLTIVDADNVAARESYPTPPPRSFVLSQHNHSSPEQGGQLNISNAISAGILQQTFGGTGANLSASSVGSIFYQNALGQFAALAAVATGNALISGGTLTAPAWGKIGLTTHVSGTLPATNGGTGHAVYVVGDIVYASTTTALSRLADVATGNALISGGVGVAPAWGKIGLATHVSGTLGLASGGTNADLSATGAGYLIQATAGANVSNLKANFAGTVAPTVNEDSGDGYAIGSLWLDTTNDHAYMAVDVTVGAAVWLQLDGSGGFTGLTDDGTDIRLTTSTDTFTVGATGESLGRFTVRGVADTPQFAIRANGTQTQSVVLIQTSAAATLASISNAGKLYLLDEIEIDGAFNHDGSTFGALNAAPAAQQAQTVDIKDLLVTFGFMASAGGATPLDTDEGLVTAFFQAEASTTSRASYNVPDGTAPSSPVGGDVWKTSAADDLFVYLRGLSRRPVWVGFTKTDQTSVSGTLVATTLLGTIVPTGGNVLPANFFKVGTTLVGRIGGTHDVAVSTSLNSTLDFQLDGVDIHSQPLGTLTTTDGQWHVDFVLTCRTTGASGAFAFGMFGRTMATATATVNSINGMSTSATFNTGNELTFDILIDPDDTDVIWRCEYLAVWSLN